MAAQIPCRRIFVRKWLCVKTKRLSVKIAFFVIRLGLEPRTPTLKVLCSTC